MDDSAARQGRDGVPEPALAVLRQAWGLAELWALAPLAAGTNNLTWRVDTPSGQFVLRVHTNLAHRDRLEFEHAVLVKLKARALPFAVPAPMPTHDGALYCTIRLEGRQVPATLTALIPGEHPHREDLAQARAAGEAIAILDAALADVALPNEDNGTTWRTSGDIARCHPLVPDPPAAIRALPLDEETRTRLLAGYESLAACVAMTYPRLPKQLLHEDTDPSNLLMEGTRVTGIVDFEFCSRDVRPMDLTIALTWWPVAVFGSGEEWPIVRALAEGYASRRTLSREEIEALPVLFLYRGYTSLVHRYGRYRQGLSQMAHVVARAEAALEREDWLRANGDRLVAEVGQAFGY